MIVLVIRQGDELPVEAETVAQFIQKRVDTSELIHFTVEVVEPDTTITVTENPATGQNVIGRTDAIA